MKKIIQLTLTALLLFAFNAQVLMAQVFSLKVKNDKLYRTETNKMLFEHDIPAKEPDHNESKKINKSMELINIERMSSDLYQNKSNSETHRITDLLVADDEEPVQLEKWMINPSDWLCED